MQNNNVVIPNIDILETHLSNEWKDNLNNYLLKFFNLNILKNQIFEEFKIKYSSIEQQIDSLFSNINFTDPTNIFIKILFSS